MKYEIEYACGHTVTTQLFGRVRDRERKIEWLKTQDCPDCYKTKIQQKREQENAEAVEKSKERNLPELKGSEKQIAWANTIRIKFLDELDKEKKEWERHNEYIHSERGRVSKNTGEPYSEEYMEERYNKSAKRKAKLDEVEKRLLEQTDSRFWIDNRDYNLGFLVRCVLRVE